jgi:hypothetical protein
MSRKEHRLRMEEVTGDLKNLHTEELYDLFSLPDIIWVIKSRKMRWAGHVAHMGERILKKWDAGGGGN